MPSLIKVVLADESRAVRLLLGSLLHEDGRFDVVADVATGAQVLEHGSEADLVVLDLVLQDHDGFSLIEDLRVVQPRLATVVFAAVDPPYLRAEAAARGAVGYFTHDTDPTQLLDGFAAAVERATAR